MVTIHKARELFGSFQLSAPNWRFADYWLSCWAKDGTPQHSDMHRFTVADVMDNTVTTRVIPGVSAICVATGRRITRLLGTDLSGKDWLAFLPDELRAVRLDRISRAARGAVACNRRRVVTEQGQMHFLQELILPFGEFEQDGSIAVITHIDTMPLGPAGRIKMTEGPIDVPEDHRIAMLT